MSDQETGTKPPVVEQGQKSAPPPNKIFNRSDVIKSVPVAVHLPMILPGYDPFEFDLRLKLSKEAQENREQFLALSQAAQVTQEDDVNLNELCDLMTRMPKGFADLTDIGTGPGDSFKSYVKTATGPSRELLNIIVRGATNLYWKKLAPQEFRS